MHQSPTEFRQTTIWRLLLGICLVMLGFALIGVIGWFWWRSHHGWTVEELEQLIRAELPPRASRATVAEWFDRHGIKYGWFDDTTKDMPGGGTVPQILGLKSEELAGMLRGDISTREAKVDRIFPGKIFLYFLFDTDWRVAGHYVCPLVLMP